MNISKLLLAALISGVLLASGCAPKATTAPTATNWVKATATALPADTAAAAHTDALSDDETRIQKFTGRLMDEAAVDFTLTDLNGKTWKLSDLKGKIVLLNFWATWCGPCLMEMPGFQRLHERFGDDGEVLVLAVASTVNEGLSDQESRDAVVKFIGQQNYTFPVPYDSDGSVWGIYRQQGIPANYILDKQGKVRLLQVGAFANDDEMMAALEAVRRLDEE